MKAQIPFRFALILVSLLMVQCGGNLNETLSSEPFSHGMLKVSNNGRFLVHEDGTPFFYLGDTAWELFHRLDRDEARTYLENRAGLGFTVIQAVVLAEENGLIDPNPYGEVPLVDLDPRKPNEAYFQHVDYVINLAEELGLHIGLLPTWGDKWNKKWGQGPVVFTPENARVFGEFLGRRYKDSPNIIWIVGGDRPIEEEIHREIVIQMAWGLRAGDEGRHLITFHPTGGQTSSQHFHNEEWLDFNMWQTGHRPPNNASFQAVRSDYGLQPVKPVIDGEPIYEDHPNSFRKDEQGHSVASDVRKMLYWNLFGGAFGNSYGHHSVWQMWEDGRRAVNYPLMPWHEAIYQPGASQMQYGRWLIESRPFLTRIPDDDIIVSHPVSVSIIPGAGEYRFAATRDEEGTYAMVYAPVGREFEVRMDVIKGNNVVAWWYNPRNGSAEKIGILPNTGTQRFLSPNPGEKLDWVLVLDDASQNYPAPGAR